VLKENLYLINLFLERKGFFISFCKAKNGVSIFLVKVFACKKVYGKPT